MNLALIGYGKMGKLIEHLAPAQGGSVALKLDEFNNANFEGITRENFRGVDVAIDFSIPAAAVENIERISSLGVNIVVGTTGWFEYLDRVRSVIEKRGTGLVWSPNFSIGVNAFFRLVAEAARLMQNEDAYEAWAYEIHHSAKKDAPSGTLWKLVEEMKKGPKKKRKESWPGLQCDDRRGLTAFCCQPFSDSPKRLQCNRVTILPFHQLRQFGTPVFQVLL